MPGGKIETGEATLKAAKRELEEETLLTGMHWYAGGAFRCTDSIHRNEDGEVAFHYVISQCFCITATESAAPPQMVASDDAADAKWVTLEQVNEFVILGHTTPGVLKVIEHAEVLYEKGMLPCS